METSTGGETDPAPAAYFDAPRPDSAEQRTHDFIDTSPPTRRGDAHAVLRLRGGAGEFDGEFDGDIIDDWETLSHLPRHQSLTGWRSPALQEVDLALRKWKKGSRRAPGRLDQNERELQNILDAIDRWWESKDGRSNRSMAINRLQEDIRGELGDVNVRRLADRALRHDSTPEEWPREKLVVKRSPEGLSGVYFISVSGGNSVVVVKPMDVLADETRYADDFIRQVGRVATPQSRVYNAGSAEGVVLHDLLAEAASKDERLRPQLPNQLRNARHYLVMERAKGVTINQLIRIPDQLISLLDDKKAMETIGRLIVLDSFLGNRDRLIGDAANLENIMYDPVHGVVAIDNSFLGADDVLKSPNLNYLRMLEREERLNSVISRFLSRFRLLHYNTPGLSTDALESALNTGMRHAVNGAYAALSEIGGRVIEHERELGRPQPDRFPSPPIRQFIGKLARYAYWRFEHINIDRVLKLSHDGAVNRLAGYIDHGVNGPIFLGERPEERIRHEGVDVDTRASGSRPGPQNESDDLRSAFADWQLWSSALVADTLAADTQQRPDGDTGVRSPSASRADVPPRMAPPSDQDLNGILLRAGRSRSLDELAEVDTTGLSMDDVHRELPDLRLDGTGDQIVRALENWQSGSYDIRMLAFLEQRSRAEDGRSLQDVVPGIAVRWTGWRMANVIANRRAASQERVRPRTDPARLGRPRLLPPQVDELVRTLRGRVDGDERGRAVELLDQVRDRPEVLSRIVSAWSANPVGFQQRMGVNFPDVSALADDVAERVRKGQADAAFELISGIEHDALSLVTLADVYRIRHRRDLFADVPALADAVRTVPAERAPAKQAGRPLNARADASYDVAQLERALWGIKDREGADVEFAVAVRPLAGVSDAGHVWVRVRLPLGRGAARYRGRVFTMGFGAANTAEVSVFGSSAGAVFSPDFQSVPQIEAPEQVTVRQLQRGIVFVRLEQNRPYQWILNNCVTFAAGLRSAVLGDAGPFRGISAVAPASIPGRRVWPPAPAVTDFEPDHAAEVSFNGRGTRLDPAAETGVQSLAGQYAQALIRNMRAGQPAPALRISAGPRTGVNRLTPLRQIAEAMRDAFLDRVRAGLVESGLPAAEQIVGTQIPVDIRADPSIGRGRVRIEARTAAPDANNPAEHDARRPGPAGKREPYPHTAADTQGHPKPAARSVTDALTKVPWFESSHSNGQACVSIAVIELEPGWDR